MKTHDLDVNDRSGGSDSNEASAKKIVKLVTCNIYAEFLWIVLFSAALNPDEIIGNFLKRSRGLEKKGGC